MRSFVYRNNTVEPFFAGWDVCFSGYDDISFVRQIIIFGFIRFPLSSSEKSLLRRSLLGRINWIYSLLRYLRIRISS